MTDRSTAQGHAVTIRDEVAAGANTATRVGTNLKELADNCAFTEDAATLLSTGLVAAGTTTAHVASVAEKLDLIPTSMGTITTGTTQPISFTDALFTGLVAGGQALNATGVLGVIATSFASLGAETGTGSNQGGLGSAASSTQPYNTTDFAGKRIHCDLRKSNNEPLVLSDVLTTAAASFPASVAAPVFLYLAYRSDLGADAKWRGWFYFRNQATGNLSPVTPDISVATVSLNVPQVVAAKDVPTNILYVPVQSLGASEVVFGATADIQPLGTAAGGTSGKVADAKHVHTLPSIDTLAATNGDVAMASHKFTGLSAGTAAGHSVRYEQVALLGTSFTGHYRWDQSACATGTSAQFVSTTGAAGNATESAWQHVMPVAGTLKFLQINYRAAANVTADTTFFVNLNGVNTAITASVAHTVRTGSDTTHSATNAAGDLASLQLTNSAADTTTTRIGAGLGFSPSS